MSVPLPVGMQYGTQPHDCRGASVPVLVEIGLNSGDAGDGAPLTSSDYGADGSALSSGDAGDGAPPLTSDEGDGGIARGRGACSEPSTSGCSSAMEKRQKRTSTQQENITSLMWRTRPLSDPGCWGNPNTVDEQ
ncbi:unnamed protein product, partial [Gadus morhua 'NCC']